MNTIKRSLFLSLCIPFLAFGTTKSKEVDLPKANAWKVDIGTGYTYLNLKQSSKNATSNNLMSFSGVIAYNPENSIFEEFSVRLDKGNIFSKDSSQIFDTFAKGKIGYHLVTSDLFFRGYTGFGYFYFHYKDQCHSIRWSKTFNDFFVIAGLEILYQYFSFLKLGICLEWDPQVFSTLALNSRTNMLWIQDVPLYNFQLEVPVIFEFFKNKNLTLSLIPFAQYWQQGKSKAVTKWQKPYPETHLIYAGLEANLGFRF